MKRAFFLALLVAGAAFGQAGFEAGLGATPVCTNVYPAGCGAPGGPEGVSWNGVGQAQADLANVSGMPSDGWQYLRMRPSGVGPPGQTEVYIPVPLGATTVSFDWDFYYTDYLPYNDAMSIDWVDGTCGAVLGNLASMNGATGPFSGSDTGGSCPSYGAEVLPVGAPQSVVAAPVVAGALFVRFAVWNLLDSVGAPDLVIDKVCFDTGCPANPPPPCVLYFSSPLGPGSIQMTNTPCAPVAGADYINAVTLAAGLYPSGWFFGLDIPFGQLVNEWQSGYPFAGTLDVVGSSNFGPITGAPSGLQIWAVSVQFAPGFGPALFARSPVTYTIP